jgi:hypothetical protein
MNAMRPIPTSLKVVAALFILCGVFSLIEIIVSLMNHRISFNFNVLGLFIGAGLLRCSPTWRGWALAFTWLALVGVPLFGLIFLAAPGPLDFRLFGQDMGKVPKAAWFALAVPAFLIAVWQYRVLTRPDVRTLFRVPTA